MKLKRVVTVILHLQRVPLLAGLVQVTYTVVHLGEVLVAYGVDIGAKWCLLGARQPGRATIRFLYFFAFVDFINV